RDKEGNLTVWCQQHDRETYAPAPARAYELASYCSNESAAILRLLMEIPKPDERIRRAVHAGMKWLDEHKIMGYSYTHVNDNGEWNATLVADSDAGPLWARFYDLENAEPYVCDRDGIPRRHLEDIGHERRNGYGWYSDNASALYPLYEKWKMDN
ncbi:MAG: pectate lyase, partial [Duncaniella sp.]